jgi:hypothetical protein
VTLAAATDRLAAATNENLANLSNTLIYSAMAVYTLAFFAYIAEWLFGSRSKVGRTAAALTGAAKRRRRRRPRSPCRTPAEPPYWSGRRSSYGPRPAPGTCRTGPARTAGTSRGTSTAVSPCPSRCSPSSSSFGGVLARAAVGAAGAVGQHVRVQHHLLHRRRRCVPHAARAEEERPLAGPVPGDHGPPRSRSRRHCLVHRQRPVGSRPPLVLAVHPRLHRDLLRRRLLRGRGRHDPVPLQGLVREQARDRRQARPFATSVMERLPASASSTSSRTASTRPSSRCGRSRSSRARSGRATRGAATGAGTPRRPGRSSPGSPTPATCTPAPRPAGRAARPRTWR